MEKEIKKVKVYSTPTCVYCVTLKRFLQEKGVDYEEVDVSLDENVAKEMVEKSGQMGVPVIEIGDAIVVGFDRRKITELLEI